MAGQLLYVGKEKDMAKSNVQFTKDNEYYTPKSVIDFFGKFDYDPATTYEKAAEFGISAYDTIETNGLTTNWCKYKRIWINPPFTIKHEFLKKACETYKQVGNEIYILFPIEFVTTKRFHDCMAGLGGKLYIPNGRINFQSGLGKKGKSPAFGSVVMKIQDTWEIELINNDDLKDKNEVEKWNDLN